MLTGGQASAEQKVDAGVFAKTRAAKKRHQHKRGKSHGLLTLSDDTCADDICAEEATAGLLHCAPREVECLSPIPHHSCLMLPFTAPDGSTAQT